MLRVFVALGRSLCYASLRRSIAMTVIAVIFKFLNFLNSFVAETDKTARLDILAHFVGCCCLTREFVAVLVSHDLVLLLSDFSIPFLCKHYYH